MTAPRKSHADASLEHSVTEAATHFLRAVEAALHLPDRPASRWHRGGVGSRVERALDVLFGAVVMTFAVGWTWSIAEARAGEGPLDAGRTDATGAIAAALTDPSAPSTAYLTDAAVRLFAPLRGESGRLRAVVGHAGTALVPDTLPQGAAIVYTAPDDSTAVAAATDSVVVTLPAAAAAPAAGAALTPDSTDIVRTPETEGVWRAAIRAGSALKPLTDFSVITLTPFSKKRRGRIGLYFIGNWPTERSRARDGYVTPSGFIEVTEENQDTPVSDHFALGDFLTHGQEAVWPKYLVLDMRLVDKLELVLLDLEQRGIETNGVRVMSGFRTPQYNVAGGNTQGRASMSRHMYGDAADIFIDNDGNGWMDDLNGDGRVNMRDAEVIRAAVDRVEQEHPALIGGAGVYPSASGHGPFIHVDVRGYRARWSETGDS